jgi:hypothetical protein
VRTKAAAIIIIGFVVSFAFCSIAIAANDTPHNTSNHIDCGSCHGETVVLNSPFWTESSDYDKICTDICHTEPSGGPYTDKSAPRVITHSSQNTSTKYGTWTKQCRDCHNPHYQRQKVYKNTDASNLYLATGKIQSCVYNGDNISTFTYSSSPPITYKTETGWDATILAKKTGDYRGAILFPNIGKLAYNYPITAVNPGANTITVNGDLTTECNNNYFNSTTFAVIYGQYIKDSILTDEVSGTYSPVKFFDQTGKNSYADADTTYNGICEVCHTQTENPQTHVARYRNTGNEDTGHYPGQYCIPCHPHTEGFKGSESPGGFSCEGCHSDLWGYMNGTTGYHHYLNNTGATYANISQSVTMGDTSDTNRNCLMCHADHNIFRQDLNPSGTRAANLRASISVTPSASDTSTYSNTDFDNAQPEGGICISCHATEQTKSYAQADNTTKTPVIDKAKFANSAGIHNYPVTSTFTRDSSTFNANCSKCHNDTLNPKSSYYALRYSVQSSTNKFGNHQSTLRSVTASLGITSPTDPLEENLCFRCHSMTTDTNPGGGLAKAVAGKDYYGVADMRPSTEGIFAVFGKANKHPIDSYSGLHKPSPAEDDMSITNRHVECCDCHNPHTIGGINPNSPVLHPTTGVDRTSDGNKINDTTFGSKALQGVWGVDVSSWPSKWTQPTDFTAVRPAEKEYQICFKCHSYYAGGEGYSPDIALHFNPNNLSAHPVVVTQNNQTGSYNNPRKGLYEEEMLDPWKANIGNQTMYCSDCHGNNAYGTNDPQGPHGGKNSLLSDFMRNGQRYYWPGGTADGNWSLYHIRYDLENWQTRLLCAACHRIWISNSAHAQSSHYTSLEIGRCTNCHRTRIHGWKHSRLIGDTGTLVAGFKKSAYDNYQPTSCYVPDVTQCGEAHLTSINPTWQ